MNTQVRFCRSPNVTSTTPQKKVRLGFVSLQLAFWGLNLAVLSPAALAIDFKIDLPADAGKSIPPVRMPPSGPRVQTGRLDLPDDDTVVLRRLDTSTAESQSPLKASTLVPLPVSKAATKAQVRAPKRNSAVANSNTYANRPVAVSVGPRNSNISANVYESKAFPLPVCLETNVAFWQRIYSEADVNDALIHDKEDLGKVYAVVKLPEGKFAREQAIRAYRDHFENILLGLADVVDSPDSWNRQQRDVAKLYSAQELTAVRLRRSASNLRIQTGLKSRFEAGVQRSLKYLPTVHATLLNAGLPADIVHLPHVESSYTPFARSKVGAVGLWQIMPDTMRHLLGSQYINSRTDARVSTLAAAKLLRQNFEATRSWPLALTAYNHGLNGVLRAVRKTGSTDLCEIIEHYDSPSFRFASSNFYAQFLAARGLALLRYEELSKRQGHGKILRPVLASQTKGRS